MTATNYSLRSNAYKSKIFTGFSQLQKQEEFVDLTLAADGCMVKVHRSLIALASPYLRDILKSLSNHSPVIFLNNVSHQILSYLLEYIYQGEVEIPADSIDAFIGVSKSLYIAGIEDLEPPKVTRHQKLNAYTRKPSEQKLIAAHITINNENQIEIQQHPQSADFENNVQHETNYSMEDQHNSANIIKNSNFIILQNENSKSYNTEQQNQESKTTKMLNNVPMIEIESEHTQPNINTETGKFQDQFLSRIKLLQSQTNIPDQTQTNTEIDVNIPVIEITTGNITEQHSMQTNVKTDQHITQTNGVQSKDYKIIVKQHKVNQPAETEALQNIPVIEIQHLGVPDQADQNTSFQDSNVQSTQKHIIPGPLDQNSTLQNFGILPTQTDLMPEAFQDNPPSTQMFLTQHQKNKINRPVIKILADTIINPGVNITDVIGSNAQIHKLLDGTYSGVSSDLKMNMDAMKNMAQFSITERGNLQLILNRYVYCLHHSSRTKRRWRCIDYRKGACRAFVDTIDGEIVARKGIHAHSFHDDKVYKKYNKGLIYQTIMLALDAKHLRDQDELKTVSVDTTDDEELETN